MCLNRKASPDVVTQSIIQNLDAKQLRLFQFYITKHISNVLGDTVFIEKVKIKFILKIINSSIQLN